MRHVGKSTILKHVYEQLLADDVPQERMI